MSQPSVVLPVGTSEATPSIRHSILVVGGGIAGITAAVEAAEVGYEVYLIEKEAYLGGRVAQLNKYFPKLCPPYCGLEINYCAKTAIMRRSQGLFIRCIKLLRATAI